MNLRDKLKAIEKPKSPPKALEKQFTDCYHGREMRELSEFPGAFDLDLSALRLMTQETLPDDLDPRNILYLDTETTGFMGAGTVAFEVGMGCLTDSGFQIHQLVMRDYPEEKFLLQSIADTLMGYDAICTFNGRTFDVPLLRDRFLMNRMDDSCLDKPHIDLLHIARRVFKLRLQRCNLGKLEEAVLGIPRFDDLPGAQVPQHFFDYLKTGNFDLLTDVLEHNAQDVPMRAADGDGGNVPRTGERAARRGGVLNGRGAGTLSACAGSAEVLSADERQSPCAGAGASCAELPPGRRARRGGKGLAGNDCAARGRNEALHRAGEALRALRAGLRVRAGHDAAGDGAVRRAVIIRSALCTRGAKCATISV